MEAAFKGGGATSELGSVVVDGNSGFARNWFGPVAGSGIGIGTITGIGVFESNGDEEEGTAS